MPRESLLNRSGSTTHQAGRRRSDCPWAHHARRHDGAERHAAWAGSGHGRGSGSGSLHFRCSHYGDGRPLTLNSSHKATAATHWVKNSSWVAVDPTPTRYSMCPSLPSAHTHVHAHARTHAPPSPPYTITRSHDPRMFTRKITVSVCLLEFVGTSNKNITVRTTQ